MHRSKLLLSLGTVGAAVVMAPTLFLASPVIAAPAAPAPLAVASTALSASTTGSNSQCGYPANRTPTVSVTASPSSLKKGQSVKLAGAVQKNKCPLKNVTVKLYSSPTQTGAFTAIATSKTTSNGLFSFTQKPSATTFYRVGFVGNAMYDAALSPVAKVVVTK